MALWSKISKLFKFRLFKQPQKKGKLPLGPEHRKFKNKILKAQSSTYVQELFDILGKPNKVEECELADRISDETGKISNEYPEKYLIYIDPWLPRVHYWFGVSDERVIEVSSRRYEGCRKCNAPLINSPVCSDCGCDNMIDGNK